MVVVRWPNFGCVHFAEQDASMIRHSICVGFTRRLYEGSQSEVVKRGPEWVVVQNAGAFHFRFVISCHWVAVVESCEEEVF